MPFERYVDRVRSKIRAIVRPVVDVCVESIQPAGQQRSATRIGVMLQAVGCEPAELRPVGKAEARSLLCSALMNGTENFRVTPPDRRAIACSEAFFQPFSEEARYFTNAYPCGSGLYTLNAIASSRYTFALLALDAEHNAGLRLSEHE